MLAFDYAQLRRGPTMPKRPKNADPMTPRVPRGLQPRSLKLRRRHPKAEGLVRGGAGFVGGGAWAVRMACVLAVLLAPGCRREGGSGHPQASPAPVRAEAGVAPNNPVWRDELLAQQYEARLVQLADALRRAVDKTSTLAGFDFTEIEIPRRAGEPISLDAGVRQQMFKAADRLVLRHERWQKELARFHDAGWSIEQVEWQQETFKPPSRDRPALSGFSFALHGEQANQSNRFILRGGFEITWAAPGSAQGPLRAERVVLTELTLFERDGAPGFPPPVVVAPEPERPGGQVNLHPLIVLDVDGDQHDDVLLPGVNKVLLNDGHAGFRLSPFIREDAYYPGQAVGVVADFNGDGQLDFVTVADRGPLARQVVLYAGNGTLPWPSAPSAAWPEQGAESARAQIPAASVIAAGDIDGDGDLDLFVAQYRAPYLDGNLPAPYDDANDGWPGYLLLNDGRGRFRLGPPQSGLLAKQRRRTLAATFADVDGDGDLDLITANDFSGVDLYYNDGHGNFSDETARLDERHLFGMGLCLADFEAEGRLDILAIGMDVPTVRRLEFMGLAPAEFPERTRHRRSMTWGNRLYARRGARWVQPAWAASLARSGWSWGACAADFDNDGDLDVYIANGHVSGASAEDYDSHYWTHDLYLDDRGDERARRHDLEAGLAGLNSGRTSWSGYQHNALFLDNGDHQFSNVAFLLGVAHETDCRAVATADLDEDGRLDLLVTEAIWDGTPNRMRHRLLVHLNRIESGGRHWVGVRIPPVAGGVSSIGTKVYVRAGSVTRVASILASQSFQTQMPSVVHFGLGRDPRVDELKIVWPDGFSRLLPAPAVDRYHWVSR